MEAVHQRFDNELLRLYGQLESTQRDLDLIHDVHRRLDELSDVKQQIARFSMHLEERRMLEFRRCEDIGHVLDIVADRCCYAQHKLATAHTHNTIKDILHSGKGTSLH